MNVRYVDRARPAPRHGSASWVAESREFELVDAEEVLGRGILTLHSISSRTMGVEVGPILVVDWVESFDRARRRIAPIATILDFIASEATEPAANGKIVGVAFDPLNPSVLRFVEKRLRTVRLLS